MIVPKCKECENYREGMGLAGSSTDRRRMYQGLAKARYCVNKEVSSEDSFPAIELNELKTSPKWCPKRLPKQ